MTKEELAEKLNGVESVPVNLVREAKRNGLVIIYGASDDLMEVDGSISDEGGCYEGEIFLIDEQGLLPSWDDLRDDGDEEEIEKYIARKKKAKKIEAVWCAKGQPPWTYKTDIPHATFDIMEDDEVQCRGIVFNINDL